MFNDDQDFFFDESPSQEVEEDSILPDDFGQEEIQEEVTEVGEDTKPPAEETEPVQPQTLKIKYNHEEREITLDEAVKLAQMGMNYDKLQEKLNTLQSDPRLSFVEELAQESNMTTEEFLQAVRDQKEQARLNELIQKNIPEDLAKEILEGRKFRDTLKAKEQAEQESQQKKQWDEQNKQVFKETFPDVKEEDIPKEVLAEYEKGLPLKYAYMEHAYKQLLTQVQVLKQNQTNAQRAPIGSVTAHGGQEIAPEDDFLKGFNSV